MTQLNLHITPTFKRDLTRFMKIRHIKTKSEAIRLAVKEGLEHNTPNKSPTDFTSWLGLAIQLPVNKKNKFQSDDDLWK